MDRDPDRTTKEQRVGKRDVAVLVLFLFAIGYFLYALRYPAGTWSDPGLGLFPRVVGVLLAVTIVVGYLHQRFRRSGRREFASSEDTPGPRAGKWRVATVAFAVAAYVVLAQRIGYVIPAVGLVWVTLWIGRQRPWWQQLIVAVSLTAGSYVLFEMLLGIPLPTAFGA